MSKKIAELKEKAFNIPHSPDNIYLNINISNPIEDQVGAVIAKYRENRIISILDKPEDYYLSIVRFYIPTESIRIFEFKVQPDPVVPANINNGIYPLTFTYLGVDYTRYVQYVNSDPSITPPSPPTGYADQDNSNYYYNVYSYSHMCQMINTTLALLHADVKAAGAPVSPVPDLGSPYIIYNPETQLISWIFPYTYLTAGVEVFYGAELERFFYGLDVEFLGHFTSTHKDDKLRLYFNGMNAYNKMTPGASIPTKTDYFEMKQDYKSIQIWSDITRLVIRTNLIPANPEFISVKGDGNPFEKILTDFEPIAQNAGDSLIVQQYFPQGPYRLIDLQSTTALKAIDLFVDYADQDGNLYPLYLEPGESLNMKLLFIKKSLAKSSLMI